MSALSSNVKSVNQGDGSNSDAKESTTIRFEWTLRGLKSLFESSKGEGKSKVTKSPRFGDGRWQILFYANSGTVGTDGQTFVSLYLACEPTTAEKERAVNGKWSREGLFNFVFEIRNTAKTTQYNLKEAHDHSFYYPGAQNWGWAQFARRDTVYNSRQQDAFVIICSITSSPANPAPLPPIPHHSVPRDLLDSMGDLLDDPLYSDVEFIIPQRGKPIPKRIYAARKLLRRVEYFDDMFSSGFTESSTNIEADDANPADDASVSDVFAQHFDDSDLEDDDDSVMLDNDGEDEDADLQAQAMDENRPTESHTASAASKRVSIDSDESWEHTHESSGPDDGDRPDEDARNIRQKLSHPSSPRGREVGLERQDSQAQAPPSRARETAPCRAHIEVPGPHKVRVVVRDCAYATYLAVLYYIYTDTIIFAPLSSSFNASAATTPSTHGTSVVTTPAALSAESQPGFIYSTMRANQPAEATVSVFGTAGPRTRKEWMAEWDRTNPNRPRPPSAKSVYRLADKLGLQDLKDRAFQHIIRSLTVHNIVHEAFSAFSAAFEDVRKVEVAYMFEHWSEVRGGAMLSIGQQLRLGRFPGFEDVWPAIIQNLVAEEKKAEGEPSRN